MKKVLILAILFSMTVILAPIAEAKSPVRASAGADQLWEPGPQRRYRRSRSSNRGRPRSWIRTRTVRRGFRVYRVTIRYTRYPNGRVRTRVIRRVRIR
jgi:hypothetical protein